MNLDVVTIGKGCFEMFVSGKEIRPGLIERDPTLVLKDKNTYQRSEEHTSELQSH